MDSESKILNRSIERIDAPVADRHRLAALLEAGDAASLFEKIDESPYALEDWLRALMEFDQWLEKNGSTELRPIDTMIGYLECCTLSLARTLDPPCLAELVRENLEQYGFDARRPASTEPEESDER